MRDGHLRCALKWVARSSFAIDISVRRALARRRGERPFALGGDCRRCARCCEAPEIRVGPLVWHLRTLRFLFVWWQRQVNGFELVRHDPRQRTFVFRCTHFDPHTRSCDSYDSRPGMCRDYPRLLLYQPAPELLPGCGYRAVWPNADALALALERQPLLPEQKAKLRAGLYLEK